MSTMSEISALLDEIKSCGNTLISIYDELHNLIDSKEPDEEKTKAKTTRKRKTKTEEVPETVLEEQPSEEPPKPLTFEEIQTAFGIYNSEMYPDPTAYHALTKIQKEEKAARYRPLVYICSPYSGNIAANTEKAKKHCRFAVDNHAIPIAPHLLFLQFMNEETERDLAMFMDMVLIGRCEQLWVFGETITEGMQAEINKANKKGIKIRHFTDLYKEYK